MIKSLPPLTWFRAFHAAARHLSFTLAADELGLTQSAISQHVRSLEHRLGTQLFVRGHRSLLLTEAGRMLVPDVAAGMARFEQATRRFTPEVNKPKLTIATSASIAQWVLAPSLASFQAANPDIAIQLTTTVWPDDFAATNAGIEIRFGSEEVVGDRAQLLQPSILHAVASPSLIEPLERPPDWNELIHLPLIQPVGISTSWADVGRTLGALNTLEPILFVDTHGLAVELALAGAGIALTHSLITRHALNEGRLIKLPLEEIPAKEGYYLACKETPFVEAQDRFVDWLSSKSGPLCNPQTGGELNRHS